MSIETHGRWPWGAAALVAPTWALAAARRRELAREGTWVAALALPILVSHQTEEWVRPGGFLPFCNERLLGSDRKIRVTAGTAAGESATATKTVKLKP